MRMTLSEQIQAAGVHYPRSYDIAYRAGFVLQALGAVAFTVLYALGHRFSALALGIFEAGVALSGVFLLVWKPVVKKIILGSLVLGLALQGMSFFVPVHEKMFLAGLGFVLVAGAGLAGKEAYCFDFYEGWILLAAYPLAVMVNLLGLAGERFNVVMSALVSVLLLYLLKHKLSMPVLQGCEGVCPLPPALEDSGKGEGK